ncbi:hypothetical protein Lal_00033515 [Lupinus albus]|uniref:Uncharacterized protein n=1 Tax=Lupinus albus TaxID=3870 RepID=A0A6A5NN02_LUPAL|nr:hypothetical protein Lalb_Chr19g0127841 [Lupinus albus]KAF1884342.1 hypothetical protein Lal_00033515 [Lupinus albus]
MPPMKIQPIDIDSERVKEATTTAVIRNDSTKPPVFKSRLRRLFIFDRQFPGVLKTSSLEKPTAPAEAPQSNNKGEAGTEFEPSSVCLAKMVQNFMEETNDKAQQQLPAPKCGRHRCNCFNGNNNDSSDEEFDGFGGRGFTESATTTDPIELLKSLIPCESVTQNILLANTAKIVEENNKVYERKNDLKKTVTEGLSSLGYDSSICKSKWDKTSSYPAGAYEFIDVIVEGERLLIDIDFRSEFEIARPTGTYKAIHQSLPFIFVGKMDQLSQIVTIVSEAAKQSFKKKGMHVPPWRKSEYMLAKWSSPSFVRAKQPPSPCSSVLIAVVPEICSNDGDDDAVTGESDYGELELIFGDKTSLPEKDDRGVKTVDMTAWQPPAVKPKSVERGAKVVTGLASLLKE